MPMPVKNSKKLKFLYFGDMCGDLNEERDHIAEELKDNGIEVDIDVTDMPPRDMDYDVLFFDWGGMSVGNSMLEHFCREFIEDAKDKPSRMYIMTSMFTTAAMEDALSYFDRELDKKPANIFLTIADAIPLLKEWMKD
jgi:hypothetical protein